MSGFVIPDSVMAQQLDDEFVLVELESGSYFGTRGVAADIWALVTQGADPAGISREISERYDGDPEQIGRDVDEFLTRLLDKGLIRARE